MLPPPFPFVLFGNSRQCVFGRGPLFILAIRGGGGMFGDRLTTRLYSSLRRGHSLAGRRARGARIAGGRCLVIVRLAFMFRFFHSSWFLLGQGCLLEGTGGGGYVTVDWLIRGVSLLCNRSFHAAVLLVVVTFPGAEALAGASFLSFPSAA